MGPRDNIPAGDPLPDLAPAPLPCPAPAPDELARMAEAAHRASEFLKALAHEGRLMILCRLAEGEHSVTELEHLLSLRQAAVSQQLARLRHEGLVDTRRDGKIVYYRLTDGRARRMIDVVQDMFCPDDDLAAVRAR